MDKTEKKRKENHATKVTKNQKTKIWDERNNCALFIQTGMKKVFL